VKIWNAELAYAYAKTSSRTIPPPAIGGACVWMRRIYDETIEGGESARAARQGKQGHAQRVTRLTIELASRVGVAEKDLVDIRRGALLHDIAKSPSDNILFKPAP